MRTPPYPRDEADVTTIKTESELREVLATCPADMRARLEIGCKVWRVDYERYTADIWSGKMAEWPSGVGCAEIGGLVHWGLWVEDVLHLDERSTDGLEIAYGRDGVLVSPAYGDTVRLVALARREEWPTTYGIQEDAT